MKIFSFYDSVIPTFLFVIPTFLFVIPAKAGIQFFCKVSMDPRLRGDDKRGIISFFAFFFFLLFSLNSFALSPETRLADEAQEARAMNLFLEVKCLVCQGQAIESSNTEFSQEMRKLIREKIQDGKTDEQIRKELVKEFGEDVLIVQPENNFTLWLLPFIFSALLAFFFFSYFRKK